MQVTDVFERKMWVFRTNKGGVVTVTKRETDFFIKHGDMTSQCPHEWFGVVGNVDKWNDLSSENNQSCIALEMANPETESSLMSIWLDVNELANIETDDVLRQFLNIGKLDKEDCVF